MNKSGKKGLYKKSVSVDDALLVMEHIHSFGSREFKQVDIPFRRYKVDLVIGALVDMGSVDVPERGSYRIVEGSPQVLDGWSRQVGETNRFVSDCEKVIRS